VSLPVGQVNAGMPLSSPKAELSGGLSPVLVELSDLLQPESFLAELDS